MKSQSHKLVAKTFSGLEAVLAEELEQLGAKSIKKAKRAVEFSGDNEIIYKVNYYSRTAISILKSITSFKVEKQDDLYDNLIKIEWDKYFSHTKTIVVNSVVYNSVFDNSHYVALRSKDAIADFFAEKYDSRPNVEKYDPDVKISIHLSSGVCNVSIDSSGQPLFKRNYRKQTGGAPLNEVLAAGLIKLSNWDKKTPLIDPMCGSGTIPIEASMIAQNIPAGKLRKKFGFQNWKDFDIELFEKIKTQAVENEKSIGNIIIEGQDISGMNIGIARQNILRAGLLGTIRLQRNDFFSNNNRNKNGILIMNPPYGKRLKKENIIDFYKKIGDTLKQQYEGFTAWIITEDDYPLKNIGLKPSRKISVFNGPIECKFIKYELYKGSKKDKK